MSETIVPADREMRLRAALLSAVEALRLARREAEGGVGDRARLAWVALALVSALKGGLIAALSGYETADAAAVMDPADPARLAPVALLLRRARSDAYLNPPERVALTAGQLKAVERVIAVRNAAVHALSVEVPDSFASDAGCVAAVIRQLLAGTAEGHAPQMAFAAGELGALEAALAHIKPA